MTDDGLALTVLAALALLCAACGTDTKTSTSASARVSCKESPEAEYEPRCKAGERDCCALLVLGKKPDDPRSVDAFGTACAGGHAPACTIVREADRPATWKLDLLTKGCAAGVSEGTCTAATFLGFVLEPEKMTERLAAFCDRAKGADFPAGGVVLHCPAADAASLAAVKNDAVACADGAFERCKALTGADGNNSELLRGLAVEVWRSRGFDADQARDIVSRRLVPIDTTGNAPLGNAAVEVSTSKKANLPAVDAKALTEAVKKRAEGLRRCIRRALVSDFDKGGKVTFDAIVDGRGFIVATTDPDFDMQGAGGLDVCAAGVVQDTKVDGVTKPSRAHVTLTLTR